MKSLNLLDLFFPKICVGCKKFGSYLCKKCFMKLDFLNQDRCLNCLAPSHLGNTHKWCKKEESLDGVLSLCGYNKTAQKIVFAVKYQLQYGIYEEVLSLVPEKITQKFIEFKNTVSNCCLQTIPLHKKRRFLRGFNQSEMLTNFFSKKLDLPIINIAKRIKNTTPQAYIKHKHERITNINKAFHIDKKQKLIYDTMILVDDVCTTSSTANELAKELKKIGAKNVYLFSFARGYR
ncbi:hypothetical protein A3A93_03785 [Candidatus Roizmanbacteria bacterium RIFCSPLOWO2_01_FULL_38_12]|uniref:Double zinc ribbon domain-containing protein n=1 Tax=Candidatus Roizmanbacteria bacterium RIFCSPLOWO2_01_FULL_38_12 TaxID=1802061 RepID=A0A1F7IYZ1_9BACT|nr:MAG: hypothetical protein A2861_04125 [Candidatus Roizmanbacteria bacterium RIFCSPHIGHO2_01_FULL_38_15]OGK48561.1 MAG: hypothetical protein A3A93_03785 [Candidatus Roizmanbacteria bacterium RIFCSPLOWO2_01_FULL_38_12]